MPGFWPQILWEADPRAWQSGQVKTVFGYPEDAKMLPFMRVLGQKLGIDLGSLRDSGSVYMRFTAEAVDIDDLRLAYGKIMSEMEIEASAALEDRHEPAPQPPKSQNRFLSPPRMSLLRFVSLPCSLGKDAWSVVLHARACVSVCVRACARLCAYACVQ